MRPAAGRIGFLMGNVQKTPLPDVVIRRRRCIRNGKKAWEAAP
jgi:hypothetical protein